MEVNMARICPTVRRRVEPPRRPRIAAAGPASPAPLRDVKTSGVGEDDIIRVLRPAAVRVIY